MTRHILATASSVLLMTASLSGAAEYNGYLTVNDEDYGYWEARVTIFPGSGAVALDEHTDPIVGTLVFELGHDLAQGLVRQYISRPSADAALSTGASTAGSAGVASGKREVAPPRGEGVWVFLADFDSFGFGQYEGSETTAGVYCTHGPKVWAWLAGPRTEGASADDVADLLIQNESGLARLKLGCDRPITVDHE